jgi:hypothetical protein
MASSSGGIRSFLSNTPIAGVAVVVVIVIVAIAIWIGMHPAVNHGQYYYTNDDGKTYFAGPVRATPYTAGGKEVVEAKVFKCGERTFVGYLRRYPAEVRARVEQQFKQVQPGLLPPSEVKRPGDAAWVKQGAIGAMANPAADPTGAASAAQITTPMCDDGKFAVPIGPPQ